MNFSVEQIAQWIGATIEGEPSAVIDHFVAIEEGDSNGISFLANPKYESYLYQTSATAVIISNDLVLKSPVESTLLRVSNPYKAFAELLRAYEKAIKPKRVGVHAMATIDKGVILPADLYIGPGSVIESGVSIGNEAVIHAQVYIGQGVKIGDNVELFPGVKIYPGTEIGNHVVIHANSVIGSDGFGFSPNENGTYDKVPQLGKVIVEDHVDIGASCTIDRATFGETRIKEGVKLDNQVHIAHNVSVGNHTVIAAQTGIAGSTKIGSHGMIGGQVGIVGHIEIGDRVKVQAQSGIARNVKDDEKLQGTPAIDYSQYNKSYVLFKNLNSLASRISALEKSTNKNIQK